LPDGRTLRVQRFTGRREDADVNTGNIFPYFTETRPFIERLLSGGAGFSVATGSGTNQTAYKFWIEGGGSPEAQKETGMTEGTALSRLWEKLRGMIAGFRQQFEATDTL
jgi:hypothetical protein